MVIISYNGGYIIVGLFSVMCVCVSVCVLACVWGEGGITEKTQIFDLYTLFTYIWTILENTGVV